ncbi:MAG: hypothetical protein NTZ38_01620 [Candidatus Taylorbacteria bacterium]|nr:hypothetical protein [Candidatus Taylorbacteria bacterium]
MMKKTDTMERDVELLFELGAFRFIERTWRQFFGMNVQNYAEHTFKVAWIATVLAKHENNVDMEKLFVKDADNLDVHMEIKEICSRGHTIGKIWKAHREQNVYPKLYTVSARKFWKVISKADPFSWHTSIYPHISSLYSSS